LSEYGKIDLPAVGITFLIPPESDPDSDPLDIAQALLGVGASSRLYHSMVYEQQLAAEVVADADSREDASLFVLTAVLSEGKKPAEAERSMLAEIKKLQDAPVSARELDKAKNQFITSILRERETNEGRAQALGEAAVLLGDPKLTNTDLDRLQAVSAADVQRVMKKYFKESNRLVLYYLPEAWKTNHSATRVNR
jgi:zinc protease